MKQFVLMMMVVLMAAACVSEGEPVPPTSQPAVSQPTSEVQSVPENVVARVNGEEITRIEFERALARTQQQSAAADLSALSFAVLDTLIEQQLINQAAAEMQITVTSEEIQTTIDAMKQDAGSDDAWNTWLTSNMYTQEEFAQAMHDQMITLRLRDAVTTTGSNTIRQVHARHILVSTEAEAQEALNRLNSGEDFASVAAQVSRDVTTNERGGDLGFFVASDLTTPELAEVAFGLQPGQIAGPVATALGYHIVQTIEFADREMRPEEEPAMIEARFNSWLQSRLENAVIERYLRG